MRGKCGKEKPPDCLICENKKAWNLQRTSWECVDEQRSWEQDMQQISQDVLRVSPRSDPEVTMINTALFSPSFCLLFFSVLHQQCSSNPKFYAPLSSFDLLYEVLD